jgi:hypothetical protein
MAQPRSRVPLIRESGAALLAFMLVFVVGASYILVSDLNANAKKYVRQASSEKVLSEAKSALIGYAVNYPESHPGQGPGYLPCPDINDSGSAGGSCSLSGGTTIGRLPFKTLEVSELRDHVGERLWYAVSENYKNNPKVMPALNSETPGNFSVDGRGDIVAVIFAPGSPVASQDRTGAGINAVANYLEGDNANGDNSFVSRASGQFDDQVITISRDELMSAVEQRVINQIRTVFKHYYATYGAYPWLAPFGDPKASFTGLRGSHHGSDNSATLDETVTVNFTDWGVQPGDTVINITDGSMGTVSAVAAHTLSVSNLAMGTDNDFDNGDEYAVITRSNLSLLTGTATAGSGTTGSGKPILYDSGKNFDGTGVTTGDIVDDLTDGSSGMIESVSSTNITVKSLTGGTNNAFAAGDSYQIRSNRGVATGGSGNLTLEDTAKDFVTMGIQAGDLVVDISDGSSGQVSTVATHTLTLDSLHNGANNKITSGDYYYIPRFATDNATREGQLSFHTPGKDFDTGFDMDWNITQANGAAYTLTSSATNLQSQYTSALQNFTETSAGTTGTITVAAADADCTWVIEKVVDCRGIYENKLVQGVTTGGSNTSWLYDNNADFTAYGIKRGDVVENYDDEANAVYGTADSGSSGTTLVDTGINFSGYTPYDYLINNYTQASSLGVSKVEGVITRVIDSHTVEVSPYPNETAIQFNPNDSYAILKPDRTVVSSVSSATQLYTRRLSNMLPGGSPDFDGGEYYRIRTAASMYSSTATDQRSTHHEFRDAGVDFGAMGVKVGDIVHNITDGSWGIISIVNVDWLRTDNLYGGAQNHWDTGDNFDIYYNYVNSRKYNLRPRFSGTTRVYGQNGVRKRDGCIGYENGSGIPDCSTSATAQSAILQQNGTTPVVTIRDYDDSGNIVASATVTVPTAGSASGSIKVSGLDYYLSESDNISLLTGTATTGSGSLIMYDSGKNFVGIGVTKGYIVDDITDGSRGIIKTVSPNQITAISLTGGTNNAFSAGDTYQIRSNRELPDWFVKNDWYRLLYVAYSSDFEPGGSGSCTAGTDCLSIQGNMNVNDSDAVVVSAGIQLDSALCPDTSTQNRARGRICDYFEDENAVSGDDIFRKDKTDLFNDKIISVNP